LPDSAFVKGADKNSRCSPQINARLSGPLSALHAVAVEGSAGLPLGSNQMNPPLLPDSAGLLSPDSCPWGADPRGNSCVAIYNRRVSKLETPIGGILIVEDSAADARDVTHVLKKAGLKNPIKWIDDGTRAMQYLETVAEPPSVIFLDVKLPGLTGFEILDRLRDAPHLNRTLRIVFSTLDDIATIKGAYARGAHSFLTKPVLNAELANLVEAFPGHWSISGSTPQRGPQFV